jgi:hypothetical protein
MNYYTDYGYGGLDSSVAGILSIYLIILVLYLLFYIISYIFKGIGMYTIAKRQGSEYPWLAFIPFARTYLHGELAGSIKLKTKTIKNPGIWFLAMPFIFGAINFVFYILFVVVGIGSSFSAVLTDPYMEYGSPSIGTGAIMGMIVIGVLWVIVALLYEAIYRVLAVLINHQILEKFTSKNMSVAHAVLCSVVPLYETICLFVMRNKEFNPGMEPDSGSPFIQPEQPVTYAPPVSISPISEEIPEAKKEDTVTEEKEVEEIKEVKEESTNDDNNV